MQEHNDMTYDELTAFLDQNAEEISLDGSRLRKNHDASSVDADTQAVTDRSEHVNISCEHSHVGEALSVEPEIVTSDSVVKSDKELRREAWKAHVMTVGEAQHTAMGMALRTELEYLFAGTERLGVRGKSLIDGDILQGVYDRAHAQDLIDDLTLASLGGYVLWATLNPFDDAVKTTNTLRDGYGSIAAKYITRAQWLVVDLDPIRPKDTEATAEERERAQHKMEEMKTTLMTTWGFAEPWVIMSGNGYQLRFRIDLPATEETKSLLKKVLLILDKTYSDEHVDVDIKLSDLPRVCKIPGTYSRKAMPTEERPQMLAYTVSHPDELAVIPEDVLPAFITTHAEMLEEVLAAAIQRQEREYVALKKGAGRYLTPAEAHARVQDFCRSISALYTTDTSDGVTYYRDSNCLFLEASEEAQARGVTQHNKNASYVCVWDRDTSTGAAGKIGAGCFTPWCQKVIDRSGLPAWEFLKRLADPEYRQRAEEWDAKTEAWVRQEETKALWDALGAEAKKSYNEEMQKRREEAQHNTQQGLDQEPLHGYQNENRELNDTGNARRLIDANKGDVIFIPEMGWGAWDDTRKLWLVDSGKNTRARDKVIRLATVSADLPLKWKKSTKGLEGEDRERAQDENARYDRWVQSSKNTPNLNRTLARAASENDIVFTRERLNTEPFLFHAANCVIDLRTGEARGGRREDYITVASPVVYDEKAPYPEKFMTFLYTTSDKNEAMMDYLLWMYGYSLVGHNRNALIFFFIGNGRDGKSTVMRVNREILGKDMAMLTDSSLLQLSSNPKHARNELASLYNKHLIVFAESAALSRLDEDVVKRFTGESDIRGEAKFQESVEFRLAGHGVLLSQHKPTIVDQSRGMWQRLRLVLFHHYYDEDIRNPNFYEDMLAEELPGILKLSVETWLKHKDVKNGTDYHLIYPEMHQALEVYRDELDYFGLFANDCLLFEPGAFLPDIALKIVAQEWGEDNNQKPLIDPTPKNIRKQVENYVLNRGVNHLVGGGKQRRVSRDEFNLNPGDNNILRGFEGIKLSSTGWGYYRRAHRPSVLNQMYLEDRSRKLGV